MTEDYWNFFIIFTFCLSLISPHNRFFHTYIHVFKAKVIFFSAYIQFVGAYIHCFSLNILATCSSCRQHKLVPVLPPCLIPERPHSSALPSPSVISSSSSSDDIILMAYSSLAHNTNTATMHDMASIKFHESHKIAPILTAGNVSPTIITQFIEYLESFFHKAKITETEKIHSCLSCFQDLQIDNWIKNNCTRFLADTYTFADFTAELHKRFLDPH